MSLQALKDKAFENQEVKTEYEKLEAEFSLVDQLISMRSQAGLTQEQVAKRMQTQKSNISRMERGNSNPSWATLLKYAQACGFELSLQSRKLTP